MGGDGVTRECDLVGAASRGDQDAFAALYDRHAQMVYRYCWRHSPDPGQTEDLLSVVFLEAWRCRTRMIVVDDCLRAWLLGVAKNVLRTARRNERRYSRALQRYHATMDDSVQEDYAPGVDDHLASLQSARAVWLAISVLPAAERDVAELCLLEDFTVAQAAAALGQKEQTVKSRLRRIRHRLRAVARTGEVQTPASRNGHVRDECPPRTPIEAMEMT